MFDVNYLDIKKGDILIIHFNKEVDNYDMKEIIEYMNKYLPENEILAANSYYINGMTVIHKDNQDSGIGWGQFE